MKKLTIALSLLLVVSFLPAPDKTYALTKNEVETVKPQLVSTLTSLGTALTHTQARIDTENALFRQYSTLLGAISVRLNSMPAPSAQELQNLKATLDEMERLISLSESWRADVKIRMASISEILKNISILITQAA